MMGDVLTSFGSLANISADVLEVHAFILIAQRARRVTVNQYADYAFMNIVEHRVNVMSGCRTPAGN
jgi:hypothetical protein